MDLGQVFSCTIGPILIRNGPNMCIEVSLNRTRDQEWEMKGEDGPKEPT